VITSGPPNLRFASLAWVAPDGARDGGSTVPEARVREEVRLNDWIRSQFRITFLRARSVDPGPFENAQILGLRSGTHPSRQDFMIGGSS
jgi:hypothetical protein